MRREHGDIILLGLIALGVMVLMGFNHREAIAAGKDFDPSAYLVVLTLIVGAVKERWTQRSVDRMGDQLAGSAPTNPLLLPAPAAEPAVPVVVTNGPNDPVPTEDTSATAADPAANGELPASEKIA